MGGQGDKRRIRDGGDFVGVGRDGANELEAIMKLSLNIFLSHYIWDNRQDFVLR